MHVRLSTRLCTALLAVAAATPALAQSVKPGLWEMSSKMQSANGEMAAAMAQMQKQMAALPPEQRKAMAEMMAKHGGAEMPTFGNDGSMITKVCMTRDMISNNQLLNQQTRGNCTQKNSPMVGNTMSATIDCTNPESHSKVRFQFQGDSGYTMSMTSTGPVNGKQESIAIDASAKWVASDCGNIKPLGTLPAAKK
ncbi:MAG: DUF3617 family protein [Gammaproteobacteria bacterium]